MDVIGLAVGIGVVLNLLLYESIGLTAGGMVVPGYLALFFGQPSRIVATLAVAWVSWLVVARVLERFAIIYGRRRYGLMLLVGMLLGAVLDQAAPFLTVAHFDWRAIGIIAPGLLANEMERQGVWRTLGITLLLAFLTRLALLWWLP